jgi:hypothetical protein
MITAVSAAALEHRVLSIKLATHFRLPVVYAYRVFVARGGLISYASDIIGHALQVTLTGSSRARSLPTCRCKCRRSTTS